MASRRPKRARDPRDAVGAKSKSKPKAKPKKAAAPKRKPAAPKRKPAAKKPAAPKRKAAAKKASSKTTWGANRKGVACKRIKFCGRTIKRCYNPDGTFAPLSSDPKTR